MKNIFKLSFLLLFLANCFSIQSQELSRILPIYKGTGQTKKQLNGWGQTQVIINGDFSTNNFGWVQSGNLYYNASMGHAQLANSSGTPGNNLNGYIKQSFIFH